MAGKVLNINFFGQFKLHSGMTGVNHAICHCSYNFPLCLKNTKKRNLTEN